MVRESHSTPRSASDASAQLGDVAYLTVTAVNSTGAFLRWGQPKDVLLPYSEQRFRPDPGKRVLVMLYSDDQGRPVATMRLDRFLTDDAWALEKGDEVDVVVADRTDLGMKVVVNHRYWGLIYQDDLTQPLRRGQSLKGFVKQRRVRGRNPGHRGRDDLVTSLDPRGWPRGYFTATARRGPPGCGG